MAWSERKLAPRQIQAMRNSLGLVIANRLFDKMNHSLFTPDDNASTPEEVPPQVYIISLFSFLSLLGCLATLLTYSLFKELRSIPGKILMNLASAILVASVLTIVSLFVVNERPLCKTVAILLHYTYTCEFFWMSVLTFEIARALRQANSAPMKHSKRTERQRLLVYFIIGWGLPLLVILCTVVVNFVHNEYVRYGGPEKCSGGENYCPNRYCFITEGKGYILSLYVPVGISLLFNFAAASFIGYVTIKAAVNRYKLNINSTASYIRVLISVICIIGVVYVLSAVFITLSRVHSWAIYVFAALGTAQGFIVSAVFILKRHIAEKYKARCVTLLEKFNCIESEPKHSSPQETNLQGTNGTALQSREHHRV